MDSDLSHIIEQALLYASPLPLGPKPVDLNDADNVHQKVTVLHEPSCHADNMTSLVAAKNDLLTSEDGIHRFVEEMETFPTITSNEVRSKDLMGSDNSNEDINPHINLDITDNLHSSWLSKVNRSTDSEIIGEELTSALKVVQRCQPTLQEGELVIGSNPQPSDLQPKIKRKRNRVKNPDPPPEAILPPCKICDEKSSGYHYGTNTCEPCKAFFRRTLKKKEVNYQCKCQKGEQEMWKQGPYKNGCPACRYERCLMMGMSQNAIKIGRYTTNHKNKNIKEVKTLEAQEKSLNKNLGTSLSNGNQTISTVEVVIIENQSSDLNEPIAGTSYCIELQKGMDEGNLLEIAFTQAADNTSLESLISKMLSSASGEGTGCQSSPTEFSQGSSSSFQQSKDSELHSSQSTGLTQKSSSESASVTTIPHYLRMGITLKEIDTIVKTLTEAHRTTQLIQSVPIEQVRQRQAEYLEKYHLKTQLFGEMRAISRAEFTEFFKATGIEIDGRNEEIECALNFFQKRIAFLVAFAKSIPGFRDLSLDDQASLIKASRVESSILSSYRQMMLNFDQKTQILITPWGREFHLKEIDGILPCDLIYQRIKYSERVHGLGMTYQEEAVLRALLTMAPDRCELHDPDRCAAMQEKLFVCLQHLLTVRHGGPGRMLFKIMDIITDFRKLTEAENTIDRTYIKPHIMKEKYSLLREFMA
ncbi:nuclear receptor ROR-beta-like [Dreissena polymorpha]|uniref:Nuclear receptor domain-containing protein n=1 Tax=Dreissena polymorpha TaxID=45954 RepID=A0A9D4BWP0_DREPO|nr:nuclear receptor ROR-beta-like [Dreissena polymorpha]KAH3712382.1 hypothetical protein DPMN_072082 [Dreissena polymorpha]